MHPFKREESSYKDNKLQSHTLGKTVSLQKRNPWALPKPKRLQTRILSLDLVWRTRGNLGLSGFYLNMFLHPLNQTRAWQSCDLSAPHRRSNIFKLETSFLFHFVTTSSLYLLWILWCWPRFSCWDWRKCGRLMLFGCYGGNLKRGETSTPTEILYTEAGSIREKYQKPN